MSEEEIRARAHPIKELEDLYKGFTGRREWLVLLTDTFRHKFESLIYENQQLKDELKRFVKIVDKYHEEEIERQDREMMDYLIKEEERFNDYSFMED